MTVFAFAADDAENPLFRAGADDIAGLPFGAAELGRDGRVVSYNDTEPDGPGIARPALAGRAFFSDVVRWFNGTVIESEFRKGVDAGNLNVVFDCAVARVPYKVRVHLKVSPILGTYWVFIKKLANRVGQ